MLKYSVRLNSEEHVQVLALVNTGRAAAAKRLQARILRKADVGADSRGWTDAAMAEALDTRAATVHRVRQGLVEQGIEAA
jgi:protein-tyrosine-phosphatase